MEQAKSYDIPKPMTGVELSSDDKTRQGYTRPARNTVLQHLQPEIRSLPVDITTHVDRRIPNPEASSAVSPHP